jgi:predicted dehydrogenase
MLKIGVLGAGHLEKYICVYYNNLKYELSWFYDPNQENADKIAKEFGYKHFSTIATLCMP